MKNQYNLRHLTEGAVLGAVWIVFLLISIFTPLFFIGLLLLPVPFTILAYRNGHKVALLTAVTASILSILFNLFIIGFSLIIYSIIVGIITGYCLHRQKPAAVTFSLTAVAILGSNLLSILFLWVLTDYNLITDLTKTIEESFVASEAILGSMGMSATTNSTAIEAVIEMIRMLLPSILIGLSVAAAYIYYQIIVYTMRRLNQPVAKLPTLGEIQLPKKILMYFIIATAGMILFTVTNSIDSFMYILLLNIVQVLSLAFAVQGIGLVWYKMNNKRWSKVIRIPILIVLLHPILLQIMTWVGMFDLFFNWRKLPN
jgi:uncharacterized protein YybS (DUF2232 family)